ncbi:hypothetical protein NDA01_28080, partial [Trichocoleus desertorum AS-A10]|uniref:hypothetical protein n=1 Tax=Trichocoleus desertorum TaxID=1481672 RepID=UPI0032A09376
QLLNWPLLTQTLPTRDQGPKSPIQTNSKIRSPPLPSIPAPSPLTKTTPTSTNNGTSRDLHGARLGTLEVRRSHD